MTAYRAQGRKGTQMSKIVEHVDRTVEECLHINGEAVNAAATVHQTRENGYSH